MSRVLRQPSRRQGIRRRRIQEKVVATPSRSVVRSKPTKNATAGLNLFGEASNLALLVICRPKDPLDELHEEAVGWFDGLAAHLRRQALWQLLASNCDRSGARDQCCLVQCLTGGLNEAGHFLRTLFAGRSFDSAGDVDGPGMGGKNSLCDIFGA